MHGGGGKVLVVLGILGVLGVGPFDFAQDRLVGGRQ